MTTSLKHGELIANAGTTINDDTFDDGVASKLSGLAVNLKHQFSGWSNDEDGRCLDLIALSPLHTVSDHGCDGGQQECCL